MVHNGIEYGLLQAYAEGYEILPASRDFTFKLGQIAKLWNHGSVVRSWLNELRELALSRDDQLAAIQGHVADSGEGRWTVEEAIRLDVPAPVITLSLLARLHSRQEESFSAKVVAALRNEFGGHAVQTKRRHAPGGEGGGVKFFRGRPLAENPPAAYHDPAAREPPPRYGRPLRTP